MTVKMANKNIKETSTEVVYDLQKIENKAKIFCK